jgi:N-acyl-D-amino-acid deacylase
VARFDVVVRNGTVVDGSGLGSYRADVGVKDGLIVEVGRGRWGSRPPWSTVG